MKAILPDGNGSVVLSDAPEPTPTEHEAIVAVAAYSINRGETFLLERPRQNWRPGKDIAGTVIRTAADGTGPTVGQRVVGHPAQGGWAEQVAVATSQLAVLPDKVEVSTAAALPLAGLTALRVLRLISPVASRRVLLTGASGGVGHYIVELAVAQGADITAVTSTAERGSSLLELGANRIVTDINAAEGQFDVVIESVGGSTFSNAWRRLTKRGLFVWMGQASRQAPTIDFFDWAGGASGTLRKFDYTDSDISDGADLATLVRLVEQDHLHPAVGRIQNWRYTADTIRALLAREIKGNAILEVDND